MARTGFHGANVYLFGGSAGIGLATARLLATRGANLLLFARNRERLDSAVDEVSRRRLTQDQRVIGHVLDVSDRHAVQAAVGESVAGFGVPRIVINTAGRAIPRHFEEIPFEQFDETMKINLYGTWNTVSAVVPHMKEQGGTIVNTSSVGGFVGVFGYADYAASKFAVIGLTEVLRSELKRYGIDVLVLCPPDTSTPGFDAENRTKPAETRGISAGGGLLQADDVARALVRGIERGDAVILPGVESKATWFLKRHVPRVVDRIMDRSIRRARRMS